MTHQDKIWLVGRLMTITEVVIILLLQTLSIFRQGASCYFRQTVLWGLFYVLIITYVCTVLVKMGMWLSNMNGRWCPCPSS